MQLSKKKGLSVGWRPFPFFLLHLAAAILLLSYMVPAGNAMWRAIDERAFFLLNGTLSGPGSWELFWAWTSTRHCDLLTGLLIVGFLVFPIAGIRREHLQSAAVLCAVMMLVLLFTRNLFHYLANWMELGGAGPSLVLTPVVRLSELFPNVPLKDASSDSFPGDHGTVLFAWTGFVLLYSRNWTSLPAAILPLTMALPRLVAGAHWLSDLVVGGLFVVLPVLGWTFYSPVIGYLANLATWAAQPILSQISQWPWFRNLQFFMPAKSDGI